jgi:hypothetical protein
VQAGVRLRVFDVRLNFVAEFATEIYEFLHAGMLFVRILVFTHKSRRGNFLGVDRSSRWLLSSSPLPPALLFLSRAYFFFPVSTHGEFVPSIDHAR